MKRLTNLLTALLVLTPLTFGQDPASSPEQEKSVLSAKSDSNVSIAARGADIRGVLFDLFNQARKNFVLEPNTHFALYLSLSNVQFDEALEILCHTATLKYEINNGIYYISKAEAVAPVKPKPETSPKALGKLTDRELMKKVTTRMSKTDIRTVFAAFQTQTGITITVSKSVPAYKIDAFLVGTSLKYSLDVITKAAGLEYIRTEDKSLVIQPKG